MKLPNAFIPKKRFNKNIEELVKEDYLTTRRVSQLEYYYNIFLSQVEEIPADEAYIEGNKLANQLSYNIHDLEILSNIETDVDEYWMGTYLSALANRILEEDDTITFNIKDKLDFLGRNLERGKIVIKGNAGNNTGLDMKGGAIIVEGDVGNSLGFNMSGGKILVKGNAKERVGTDNRGGRIIINGNAGNVIGWEMEYGLIVIKGNTGWSTGLNMKGGTIVIKGDTGRKTGNRMEYGTIKIYGNIEEIHPMCDGTIYHKNKIKVKGKEYPKYIPF